MSGFSGVMKGGWHPEKSKSSSSSGGSSSQGKSMTGLGIRNKTNAMIPGNSAKKEAEARANHVSAPLASLKDPSSFAPPPKRTGTGLAPPPPPSSNGPRKVITAPSKYQDPRAATPAAPPPKISSLQQLEQEEVAPAPRTGPYRADTTGLSTDKLPKPPTRRDVPALPAAPASPAPPSYETATRAARPVPSLPPRLPARTNTGGSIGSTTSNNAPQNGGMLNTSAANRLGASGISVPALGINRSSPAANNSSPSPPPPPRPGVGAAQVNALQNRFAKLGTSTTGSSPTSPQATTPQAEGGGTTWQQKQAALQAASNFQKDPSSVSLSDARSAASTANNFRQRHGEQVASGLRSANNLNQKYGVADKVGGLASQTQGGEQSQPQQGLGGMASALAAKKKPPPPPPKKKPGLGMPQQTQPVVEDDAPPPIPTATRPQF